EHAAAHAARQRGLDGIICGHIHCAVMREVDGVSYVNCGDWVDSCTAIVEHHDGRLELIDWGSRDDRQAGVATASETETMEAKEAEELTCAS
ncbi:MAG: UDP-2,3-diacylglucosamine diphosphatase, partial [Propionivibrio sp.]